MQTKFDIMWVKSRLRDIDIFHEGNSVISLVSNQYVISLMSIVPYLEPALQHEKLFWNSRVTVLKTVMGACKARELVSISSRLPFLASLHVQTSYS